MSVTITFRKKFVLESEGYPLVQFFGFQKAVFQLDLHNALDTYT